MAWTCWSPFAEPAICLIMRATGESPNASGVALICILRIAEWSLGIFHCTGRVSALVICSSAKSNVCDSWRLRMISSFGPPAKKLIDEAIGVAQLRNAGLGYEVNRRGIVNSEASCKLNLDPRSTTTLSKASRATESSLSMDSLLGW